MSARPADADIWYFCYECEGSLDLVGDAKRLVRRPTVHIYSVPALERIRGRPRVGKEVGGARFVLTETDAGRQTGIRRDR